MFTHLVSRHIWNTAAVRIFRSALAASCELRAARRKQSKSGLYVLEPRSSKLEAGFSLVELLVVTGIFVVITGIVLASNSKFGGQVLLQNLAYDIALSVREAQVYGISVRQYGSGNFNVGYAVHFALATPSSYVLFADVYPSSPNGLYEADHAESVESIDLGSGYRIVDLCSTPLNSSTEACGNTSLDILFKRPEPDAYISANGLSAILNPGNRQQRARIIVRSPRGNTRSIVVEATGQIAIQSQ